MSKRRSIDDLERHVNAAMVREAKDGTVMCSVCGVAKGDCEVVRGKHVCKACRKDHGRKVRESTELSQRKMIIGFGLRHLSGEVTGLIRLGAALLRIEMSLHEVERILNSGDIDEVRDLYGRLVRVGVLKPYSPGTVSP